MEWRLDALCGDLALDRGRVRAWGIAQAVELRLWLFSVGYNGDRMRATDRRGGELGLWLFSVGYNGMPLVECARLLSQLKA
jgi:hypothetical protein